MAYYLFSLLLSCCFATHSYSPHPKHSDRKVYEFETALTKVSAVFTMPKLKTDYLTSKARLKELKGEKSRLLGSQNELHVAFLISKHNPTFNELKQLAKLSSPSLAKHLRNLLDAGFIYKDTVKSDETNDSKRIGKTVFRMVANRIDDFSRHIAEMGKIMADLGLSKEMEKDLNEHYEAISRIWSEYLKSLSSKELESE